MQKWPARWSCSTSRRPQGDANASFVTGTAGKRVVDCTLECDRYCYKAPPNLQRHPLAPSLRAKLHSGARAVSGNSTTRRRAVSRAEAGGVDSTGPEARVRLRQLLADPCYGTTPALTASRSTPSGRAEKSVRPGCSLLEAAAALLRFGRGAATSGRGRRASRIGRCSTRRSAAFRTERRGPSFRPHLGQVERRPRRAAREKGNPRAGAFQRSRARPRLAYAPPCQAHPSLTLEEPCTPSD